MTETEALIARHTRETKDGTGNARQQVIELVEHAMRMERERDALKAVADEVADRLEKWGADGSRPDEWLLKEWADILRRIRGDTQ